MEIQIIIIQRPTNMYLVYLAPAENSAQALSEEDSDPLKETRKVREWRKYSLKKELIL